MKKCLRILLIIVILLGSGLFYYYFTTNNNKITEITNPASIFCEQNSWTLEITTDLNWNQGWICHLPNGTICDERAYFRGECSVTWAVETTGTEQATWTIATSWWLMNQTIQDIANQQTNVFIYQPLWLSFIIPVWRTAKTDTINPCRDTNCPIEGIHITTDAKDTSWYTVYVFLKIEKIDRTTKWYQKYIQAIDTPNWYDKTLVNQPDKKLIQMEGVAGQWSFVLQEKGEYFYIEIFTLTSEQPRPSNLNDYRVPTLLDQDNILNRVRDIIESITK